MRIAMWSGPRNLSTAMMYAFAARGDCAVVDEPFYAAYLSLSGLDHPMRTDILRSQNTDPAAVENALLGPVSGEKPHFYQKHMAHHMLTGVPRDWMRDVTNVFLIRHPARVVASYAAKRERPTLDDIGFRQQAELFDLVGEWGQDPVVIDSYDIRANPERALAGLCDAIGLSFTPRMLSWPKGGRPEDGVWAAHWYAAVHGSTGFAAQEGHLPDLPEEYAAIAEQAMPYYQALSQSKIAG